LVRERRSDQLIGWFQMLDAFRVGGRGVLELGRSEHFEGRKKILHVVGNVVSVDRFHDP
jgi:hypothetical protein